MYIIGNALKSISRNKLRNILIGIIVLVIAVSACIALSIREAAETTKDETLGNMTVTAQISYDRSGAMQDMKDQMGGESKDGENSESGGGSGDSGKNDKGDFDRSKFDFDALSSSLTLDDYMTYTEALSDGDSYYYSASTALNASGDDFLAYGTSEDSSDEDTTESSSSSSSNTSTQPDNNSMPDMNGSMGAGNEMGGGDLAAFTNQGDFTVTGYSSYEAMTDLFDSVSDGSATLSDNECLISSELAEYNNLSVGDTITLCNPNYEDETYTLTICGIYVDSSSSDQSESRFMMSDPANNIYTSYDTISAITAASEEAGNTMETSENEETSAALTSTISFTYVFADADNYETFSTKVYDLGLSEDYTVSSSDLTEFENSLAPLETLSTTAMWFFLIVIAVGGIILVTINIFNLRERKYEVGVLTAIGMKKSKVGLQFLTEIFIVTFAAIIIGTAAGACVSVPVTNALLESQITSSQQTDDNMNEKFGFDSEDSNAPANIGKDTSSATADMPDDVRNNNMDGIGGMGGNIEYVTEVSSATNLYVVLELVIVGIFLTIISSLAALISILRYEPLKILSNRS